MKKKLKRFELIKTNLLAGRIFDTAIVKLHNNKKLKLTKNLYMLIVNGNKIAILSDPNDLCRFILK